MRKRSKRLCSLLMALVMALSLLPTAVFAAEPAEQTYVKVTEAPEDWSGTYLIVYETGKLILNGSLDTLDAKNNTVDVTIADAKIIGDYAKYAFTVEKMENGYAIQSASGKYISGKAGSNVLNSGTTQAVNTISMDAGAVSIISDSTALQYNVSGARFRYYRNADQNRFDQARCPLIIVNIFPLIIRISDDIIDIHRIFQFLERDVHRARVHACSKSAFCMKSPPQFFLK